MTALQLPDQIDSNEPHVEFCAMQCRECEALGPWVNLADKESPGHLWDGDHAKQTGHRRFYLWTVARSNARVGL